jgi:hypothetical protein
MLSGIRDGDVPDEYRLVLVDDDGHLEHVLLVRPGPPTRRARRRRGCPRGRPRRRGRVTGQVIVELAAATTMFAALDPDDHAAWAGWIRRAQHQLATLADRGEQVGGPNHPATTIADTDRRFPGAALERWTRVRDRCCVGPMCSDDAHRAEIDHTRDWAHHGRTVAANLGPLCGHCHWLKHRAGWQLTQPDPGCFQWRSPLGAGYTVAPRPVLETPLDPAPPADRRPRPVHGIPRPPRPESSGWVEKQPRLIEPDEIPSPPGRTRKTGPDDDPPPF